MKAKVPRQPMNPCCQPLLLLIIIISPKLIVDATPPSPGAENTRPPRCAPDSPQEFVVKKVWEHHNPAPIPIPTPPHPQDPYLSLAQNRREETCHEISNASPSSLHAPSDPRAGGLLACLRACVRACVHTETSAPLPPIISCNAQPHLEKKW